MDLTSSEYGPVVDFYEHINEPLGYINGKECLFLQVDRLSASQEEICSM